LFCSKKIVVLKGKRLMPVSDEIDKQRIMNENYMGRDGNRAALVLHEMLEMFEETNNNPPYVMTKGSVPPEKFDKNEKGVHNKANQIRREHITDENDPRYTDNPGGGDWPEGG
jgi:hypothetical protein